MSATLAEPAVRTLNLAVIPEDDGGYSILAMDLPGTGSCGDDFDEAMANFQEALDGVLESYRDDQLPVPWRDVEESDWPEGALRRSMTIHV